MLRRRDFIKIAGAGIGMSFLNLRDVSGLASEQTRKPISHSIPSFDKMADYMIHRMPPGNLVVIAGRPLEKAVSLSLLTARKSAVEMRAPVAVFSPALPSEKIGKIMLEQESGMPLSTFSSGNIGKSDWRALAAAAHNVAN